MKIILREHVDHLGQRGDIVNVAAGYARNFLLPKGLAYLATPGNLKQVEHQHKAWAVKEAHEISEAEAIATRLRELRLEAVRKAGENGTLYGSVTNGDIADMLGEKGIEIDRRRIALAHPIKSVGTHGMSVRLHPKVVVELSVLVVGEGGQGMPDEEPAEEVAPVAATENGEALGGEAETSDEAE